MPRRNEGTEERRYDKGGVPRRDYCIVRIQGVMDNTTVYNCDVWVQCAECNMALHRVFAGDRDGDGMAVEPPWWVCRDEVKEIREGEQVEVLYIEKEKGSKQSC